MTAPFQLGGLAGTALGNDPLAALITSSPACSFAFTLAVLGPVLNLRADQQQELLVTLRTWFQTRGKTAEAARLLYCHRNTVRNRLHRLEKLSGRSLEDPRGIAELLIAVEAISLLEQDGGAS